MSDTFRNSDTDTGIPARTFSRVSGRNYRIATPPKASDFPLKPSIVAHTLSVVVGIVIPQI